MVNFKYLKNLTTIKIQKVSRPIESFYNEVLKNARFIKDNSNSKIMVCLSGGIDSEVACIGFIKENIDFEVLTVEYTDNKNSYDCYFAKKFCKDNSIKQHIIKVDPENFYTDTIDYYKKQGVFSHSIYRYLQIFLLDTCNQMGFTGVCGAGEQLFLTFDNIINVKYEPLHIPEQWLNNNKLVAYPSFYLASPEIQASYYNNELIKLLLNDYQYFITNSPLGFSAEKILIFHKFFNLDRRQKKIGYEEFIPLKNKLELNLKEYYDHSKYFYKPVSEVIKELEI